MIAIADMYLFDLLHVYFFLAAMSLPGFPWFAILRISRIITIGQMVEAAFFSALFYFELLSSSSEPFHLGNC